MSISKKYVPVLGADYSGKMKSRYAEKVKPSGKIYTKADRRDNRVSYNMTEESQQEIIKESHFKEDVCADL